MQREIVESMHDQVRAIYRALTGEDVSESAVSGEGTEDTDEVITQRFAELEVMARAFPSVVERVPPFMFSPAIDVVADDGAVVLELALPGIDRDDITVERLAGALQISGIRRDSRAARGLLFHAEIPRGPFFRVVPLPAEIEGEPRIELDRGVLRIYLKFAIGASRDAMGGNSNAETDERRTGK